VIYKDYLPGGHDVRVTFELPACIWAERVNLVGDFNDWETTRDQMQQSRANDNWRITLVLPKGREYQFRYLVNGRDWHNDWHADRYAATNHGTDNSVVIT